MGQKLLKTTVSKEFPWNNPSSDAVFLAWKNSKKKIFESMNAAPPISIESLENCPTDSVNQLKIRCSKMNFALYDCGGDTGGATETGRSLLKFAQKFGLHLKEEHRSGGEDGVVALTPSSEKSKKGYIPYTPKPLNWHTDGYYNASETPIKAFLLHCHTPAAKGGVNQIIDPEIAYMRLREVDPSFIEAFFHPEAMVIPENVEKDGKIRPASVGPVFFTDKRTGRLQMRYTARTRSIEWRDDPATQEASHWIRDWLTSDDPYKIEIKLSAGQGILNNNVLHNRTGFEDDPDSEKHRTILRVRFHDRIEEE